MSISAMKEALEALENTYAYLPRRWGGEREADQAITALRQAIAEAEKQEPMNVDPEKPDHIDHPMRHWDRTCPACVYESDMFEKHVHESDKDRHEWVGQPDLATVGEVGVWGDKREWVGFTHEELAWLNEALNLGGRFAVIEAIEAKLKEKNA
jgi:hypothetical protein